MMYNGRSLVVNKSLPRGSPSPKRRGPRVATAKLYVGNLDFDTDEETIASLFQDYGDILDVYMPMDQESGGRRSRGFAFVTMERDAAMRAADETDGFELDGRVLRVNEAQPKGSARGGGGM